MIVYITCIKHTIFTVIGSGRTRCKFLARLIAKTHERLIDYFGALPWLNTRLLHEVGGGGGGGYSGNV